MSRALAANFATAVARKTGSQFVHLVELHFAGGTLYLTDASQTIVTATPAHTWTAVGGAMTVGAVEETTDAGATAVDLSFSGVDQSLLADVLLDEWRGQTVAIYLCHFESTGAVTADPYCVFKGRMTGGWTIRTATDEQGHEVTVTVATRCAAYVAELALVRGRRTNPASQARVFPADSTAFRAVALQTKKTLSWGGLPLGYVPTADAVWTGRGARRKV